MIYKLGVNGLETFMQASNNEIVEGLVFGQALAALNCSFAGARGLMYQLQATEVLESADLVISSGKVSNLDMHSSISVDSTQVDFCARC